jgi:hypothetical protein
MLWTTRKQKTFIFDCTFTWVVWFGSPIDLKSDALPSSDHGLQSSPWRKVHLQVWFSPFFGASRRPKIIISSIPYNGRLTKWFVTLKPFDTFYTIALDTETPNPAHTDANNHITLGQRTHSTSHIYNEPNFFLWCFCVFVGISTPKSNWQRKFYPTKTHALYSSSLIQAGCNPVLCFRFPLLFSSFTFCTDLS